MAIVSHQAGIVPTMQAKSDTIDALEAYREHSEPTFLMFAVSGARAPSCAPLLISLPLPHPSPFPPSHLPSLPSLPSPLPPSPQGGELVAVVRGALGPQLEKTLKEQLEYEHQVLEGKAERKPVRRRGACTSC